jgi:hypothetical protein
VQLELSTALAASSQKDSGLESMSNELFKLKEIVTERERALETSALKMAENNNQLDASQRKISDLRLGLG